MPISFHAPQRGAARRALLGLVLVSTAVAGLSTGVAPASADGSASARWKNVTVTFQGMSPGPVRGTDVRSVYIHTPDFRFHRCIELNEKQSSNVYRGSVRMPSSLRVQVVTFPDHGCNAFQQHRGSRGWIQPSVDASYFAFATRGPVRLP